MKLKGIYRQNYTVDREAKELVVEVQLRMREGFLEPFQNLYYGTAIANGKVIEHKDLSYCVNAEYMAETIGKEIIQAWKIRAKKQNKIFRLKKV